MKSHRELAEQLDLFHSEPGLWPLWIQFRFQVIVPCLVSFAIRWQLFPKWKQLISVAVAWQWPHSDFYCPFPIC
jgi:hypothetical protein